jgi:hypothetical protein
VAFWWPTAGGPGVECSPDSAGGGAAGGLTGLAAVPVTLLFIRRTELARALAASLQRVPSVAGGD